MIRYPSTLRNFKRREFPPCSEGPEMVKANGCIWKGRNERRVVTYFSPSSPGLACVSNILFYLFSSDSCIEIAPFTAEIAVESFLWSDAGGPPMPTSQSSAGKRRGKPRGNIGYMRGSHLPNNASLARNCELRSRGSFPFASQAPS
jgi:hypothetical protein